MSEKEFDMYLDGRCLYGDDFSIEKIEEWYRDETEGYSSLIENELRSYEYLYHKLNELHGFSKLAQVKFPHVVGLGSAFGHEFKPIAHRIEKITIIEPSKNFDSSAVDGVPVDYVAPSVSGRIGIGDCSVDLVTIFGTLHHIPNVTYVVSEVGRILKKGCSALVREPVVNMGDWRKPRRGLTKRERGIPKAIMLRAFEAAGLEVVHQSPCMFPLTPRIARILQLKTAPYNSYALTRGDSLISKALSWNTSYSRKSILKKVAPVSVFWVCTKR